MLVLSMPTRSRVQGSVVELSEVISDLGYEVGDFVGPIGENGEEVAEEEISDEEDYRYYLTGDAQGSKFFITFSTGTDYASVVYPMDIRRHLTGYLDESEIEAIIEDEINWDDLTEEEKQNINYNAVQNIIENTDPSEYLPSAFTLSAYASTALVSYRQTTTSNGFPVEFQCDQGIFPYTEQLTLQSVDNRIQPVLTAGERGRRYVEYSFRVDKENKDPSEYEFRAMF